jgi:hypothetical protein
LVVRSDVRRACGAGARHDGGEVGQIAHGPRVPLARRAGEEVGVLDGAG